MSNIDIKIQHIPLHLIDEPEHAMRSDIHDDELVALANSIKQFGLLQPITLRKRGERYEVIAGHRRLMAHRHINYPVIASIVREADDTTTDAMKVHENLYRADVNPVDQAVFLHEYMERAQLTPEGLAEQLNRSVNWIYSRLELLQYPDYLIEFIGEGKLSMATASILNQIQNPAIKEKFCRDAAIIGLSATRAKFWLNQANLSVNNPAQVRLAEEEQENGETPVQTLYFTCELSGEEYPASDMIMVYVHPQNLAVVKEALKHQEQS